MRNHHEHTLAALGDLAVGAPLRHRGVAVLPLFLPERTAIDYRIGADAIAAGRLEIREVAGGAVDKLEARNRSRDRVFFLEGDHLVGARQNRVVTSSVLIGKRHVLTLPVSCVEQGRWNGPSNHFNGASWLAPASVRRTLKQSVTSSLFASQRRAADQAQIWRQIAEQQARLHVTSATHALHQTYVERARDVEDVAARIAYAERANGLAIAIGGELVSIDLFDKPETCRFYWRWLVDGAALEAIGRPPGRGVAVSEVHELVAQLLRTEWRWVAPVGEGEELRARTPEGAASILMLDGQIVHFGVAAGGALNLVPRVLRRDLPETLARRYRIVERIGVGGAKEVFRATDLHGAHDVAIARLPGVDPEEFAREVAVAASAQSDFTARVFGSLVDEHGDGYLVMEHCAGPNLAELEQPLTVEEAAPILLAFARALRSIHEARVLHRDVKLENAVLCSTAQGVRLKILDFGISARAACEMTAVGQVPLAGTLPYMAREVLDGAQIDARADVFAFGVCCFRLLTGGVPTPPVGVSQLDYLARLMEIEAHDLSRLPALPPPAGAMLARMLEVDRDRRPFMPEVVAAFERAFGDPPLVVPTRQKRPARAARSPPPLTLRIGVPVAHPDHLLVAPCENAPVVALEPCADSTLVRAFGRDGGERWSRRIEGRVDGGIRVDLDRDGEREIYLAGPSQIVALSARGELRFARVSAGAPSPTMIAVAYRIVVDGLVFDPLTGAPLGRISHAYEGDGQKLVDARSLRGLSFNGYARQSFHGGHGTGAAIVSHRDADRFCVVHLEETSGGRVQLVVYGPGGARLHALPVADRDLRTGDRGQIACAAPFAQEHAPLALLGDAPHAVVVAPLVGAERLPSGLAAFALPSGRVLWRAAAEGGPIRAMFADVEGDGRPRLIVGTRGALVTYDPWTGAEATLGPCGGLPVAFGDPFDSGFAHLFTASPDGIEMRRVGACHSRAMQWSGPRGDLWRTGTMRADGRTLGPI